MIKRNQWLWKRIYKIVNLVINYFFIYNIYLGDIMVFSYRNKEKSTLCSSYTYIFENNDFITYFYQSPNGDLSLSTVTKDANDKVIELRKDENYQLYKLFDEFYNELDDYKDKYGYDELFASGIFSWKSDAPANELAINEPFIYNYLKIIKDVDVYKLILVNNINTKSFVVEFNTDRSRYGALVLCIWSLFNRLKELTIGYHQITIDEYLYQKTLAKK